ncbi:two-component system response regulator [Streptomyces avermitilis]|uniref:Two-component system response regulator n=2 Tax=Streptomyces avermitilis TaxID=33903 RepID=Q82BP8_STRAW|nr:MULTISPECIES: response regulator transcription factor [Streptomyces]KUN50415.1 two-component system response regulator [Streptomyces avermitilis]MYT01232.1 response regulator [Streptomyces sp. SID5469]OOV30831.1 DNA-binding response regulator [Streptomyces avermitilis]BAC73368.1 putative two-component system response regulator [Streptomyces avermitilis MA-4680 = NBRC 14893]BBJ53832.1 DNA-binding response regulator [Streptomyces avermitilis]
MGLRVLLIEDDETIAEPLAEGLGHFGLTVDHVATGTEGLRGPYGDVVLLDLGLPDMDGIDVCRGIRQVSGVPIVILSARGEEADRVLGLELGADDYLAKPFSMRELVARVRAVTRRTQRARPAHEPTPPTPTSTPSPPPAPSYEPTSAPAYQTAPPPSHEPAPRPSYEPPPHPAPGPGPLVVDRRTRQVWVGEQPVVLTPKEFELLALLTEDPGAVYSRQQILDRVWDPHYQGPTKTLDVHVATLRRKLGHPAWIQTLRGVGFRLAVHTEPSRRRHQQVAYP